MSDYLQTYCKHNTYDYCAECAEEMMGRLRAEVERLRSLLSQARCRSFYMGMDDRWHHYPGKQENCEWCNAIKALEGGDD